MSDWTRLSLAVMDYIEEDVWDMREKYFYTLDVFSSWMYNIREERAGKAGFTPAYSSTDGFLLPAINIYQFITLSFNVTGINMYIPKTQLPVLDLSVKIFAISVRLYRSTFLFCFIQ